MPAPQPVPTRSVDRDESLPRRGSSRYRPRWTPSVSPIWVLSRLRLRETWELGLPLSTLGSMLRGSRALMDLKLPRICGHHQH